MLDVRVDGEIPYPSDSRRLAPGELSPMSKDAVFAQTLYGMGLNEADVVGLIRTA